MLSPAFVVQIPVPATGSLGLSPLRKNNTVQVARQILSVSFPIHE